MKLKFDEETGLPLNMNFEKEIEYLKNNKNNFEESEAFQENLENLSTKLEMYNDFELL